MRKLWVIVLAAGCWTSSSPSSPPPAEPTIAAREPEPAAPVEAAAPAEGAQPDGGTGVGTGPGYGVRPANSATPAAPATGRDRNAIRQVVRRHVPEIRFCYEKELVAKPALAGTVQARFTIARDGTVSTSTATGVDPDVASCIATRIRTWRFAPAQDVTTVNYPFVLHDAP